MNDLEKIKNLLHYTTTSGKAYNGSLYSNGYHSMKIQGIELKGQRNPAQRLSNVSFNFDNQTVLDLGSNQGGMLLYLQDQIKQGVGIDFDHRLVNCANKIKNSQQYTNLGYYVFDLEKEDTNLLLNFLDNQPDIIFLLSVCMWIKNWKDVCAWCSKNSPKMLFESNGSVSEQENQLQLIKSLYDTVIIINEISDDDPKQKNRKLYYCENHW